LAPIETFRVERGSARGRDLARAANDLAKQRNELLDDVEAQIRHAKATVEEEKNRSPP
jgi:DNA polymerase-3 subunit epsilon